MTRGELSADSADYAETKTGGRRQGRALLDARFSACTVEINTSVCSVKLLIATEVLSTIPL